MCCDMITCFNTATLINRHIDNRTSRLHCFDHILSYDFRCLCARHKHCSDNEIRCTQRSAQIVFIVVGCMNRSSGNIIDIAHTLCTDIEYCYDCA